MRLPTFLVLLLSTAIAQASDPVSYGAPLPAGDTIPVSRAVAEFDAHAGKPQRYAGRITEVCQAEGCWMMLEDDGKAARVMFRDHAFLVPKDTTGHAVVHGVLSRKDLTPEQVEHLREDGGGKPVDAVEYRISADGIEVAS